MDCTYLQSTTHHCTGNVMNAPSMNNYIVGLYILAKTTIGAPGMKLRITSWWSGTRIISHKYIWQEQEHFWQVQQKWEVSPVVGGTFWQALSAGTKQWCTQNLECGCHFKQTFSQISKSFIEIQYNHFIYIQSGFKGILSLTERRYVYQVG